jgi:KDO2-lipid IV(A) lauroyltransferase
VKREPLIRFGLLIARLGAGLPLRVLRSLGDLLGTLAWWLAAPRRRVTLINLRLCFPDWGEDSRRAVARAHFRVYARSFLDRFIVWQGDPARIRGLCALEGLEHLHALRLQRRPVIVLAPHFMGIDAGGLRLLLEQPMASMFALQRSRALTEAMTVGRVRLGATMIPRREGVRPLVRWLRDGGVLHYSPDMDLGRREALFVPFFGVPAATVTALPRLARAGGAVILPMVTRMTEEGYVARIHEPWEIPDDESDPRPVLEQMNAFIEAQIRQMPEQYLWSHRRFKTRPEGEPHPYARTNHPDRR